MSKIGYIFRCICGMDYKRLFLTVGSVSKKRKARGESGMKLPIMIDIVKCGLKYGTGYTDYELNEWWELNSEQRSTYITRGINHSVILKCNKREDFHLIDDKCEFNRLFSDCIGRKWLEMSGASYEDFEAFIDGISAVIIKPSDSCCGNGIEKLYVKDYSSIKEMYEYIKQTGSELVEESIVQHGEMSRLYPLSVNTLRIVTLRGRDEKSHVVYAFIRLGNHGNVVDNLNAGGLACPIDIESGTVSNVGFDKAFNYYDEHPYTGEKLCGFKIPLWEDAIKLVLNAAERIPTLGYVGWDVAVKEDSVVLIEANQCPGHDLLQMPRHTPDKIGILPTYRKYIDI